MFQVSKFGSTVPLPVLFVSENEEMMTPLFFELCSSSSSSSTGVLFSSLQPSVEHAHLVDTHVHTRQAQEADLMSHQSILD